MSDIKKMLAEKYELAKSNLLKIKNYQVFIKGEGEIALQLKGETPKNRAKAEIVEDGLSIDTADILLAVGAVIAVKAVVKIIDSIF